MLCGISLDTSTHQKREGSIWKPSSPSSATDSVPVTPVLCESWASVLVSTDTHTHTHIVYTYCDDRIPRHLSLILKTISFLQAKFTMKARQKESPAQHMQYFPVSPFVSRGRFLSTYMLRSLPMLREPTAWPVTKAHSSKPKLNFDTQIIKQ